jgi:hypothetical protein
MVSRDPIVADDAERLVIVGTGNTVKRTPFEVPFDVVTTTFPVVAAFGTGTTMLVPLQLVGMAAVPLNVTVLVPCVLPKLTPEIVTDVPAGPDAGERLFTVGVCETLNGTPLLDTPLTVTTMFPDVAPRGTGTVIDVELQLVGNPVTPLNITVLDPCVEPKLVPVIVTTAPGTAVVGDRPVMDGLEVAAPNVL